MVFGVGYKDFVKFLRAKLDFRLSEGDIPSSVDYYLLTLSFLWVNPTFRPNEGNIFGIEECLVIQ